MKYPQFFAVLADQVNRFAPEIEVPAEMEAALTEFCSRSLLVDIDPPLLGAFSALLEPRFRKVLTDAKDAVAGVVTERLSALTQQRADTEAAFLEEQGKAVAAEKAFREEHAANRKKLEDLQHQFALLHEKVESLSK